MITNAVLHIFNQSTFDATVCLGEVRHISCTSLGINGIYITIDNRSVKGIFLEHFIPAFALQPNPYQRKMEAKSEQMRFVGYQKGTTGYRLYDEKNKRLVICRDVVFKEVNVKGDEITVTPVDAEPSDMTKIGKDVHDPDLQSDFQDVLEAEMNNSDADKRDDSATTTRSGHVSRKPRCLGDWAGDKELEFLDLIADSSAVQHCLFFHGICEPQSKDEALETPEATHWKQAADEEMEALNKMNTWKVVELPEGQKPTGCHWIF